MKKTPFKILSTELLGKYCDTITADELNTFKNLEESEITIESFSFYTSVSAVFSSKIEGEDIELDSYVKHKRFGIEYLPDYTKKIDDLYNAYQFAKKEKCSKANILAAHAMLTKNILPKSKRGKMRMGNMYVTTADGRIEYVATSPYGLAKEMDKLYDDIEILFGLELNVQEVFFFASLIHLVFVKIHPFDDGNGRISRLIEKWFLAEKLGEKAWLIESEKNYYLQHQTYYKNIRLLGLEYGILDYNKALPFLLMLPQSLLVEE